VYDDICVVTCRDGSVWGINTQDGTDRWRAVDLGGRVSGAAVIVPRGLGFDGGAVVAAGDGSVRAIDLRSGEGREMLPAGAPVMGSPVVVTDNDAMRNFVYVVRSDGSLYSIDPASRGGNEIHRLADGATGALAAVPGFVAAADGKGGVDVLNTDNGRLWRMRTQGQVFGSPVIAEGFAYAASTDGQLYSLRLSGSAETEDQGDSLALGAAPVHAAPLYRPGRLYVGASDGRVHAFEVSPRGDLQPAWRWTDPLGAEVAGLALELVATERGAPTALYVAAGYRLLEIDDRARRLRREVLRRNYLISGAPVISGGFGYIIGLGGMVERVALR
jgi:outer membrane protein assembly factor BamB